MRLAVLCLALVATAAIFRTHVLHAARSAAKETAAVAAKKAAPEFTDSFGDGTPDFLRLDSPQDRAAFRKWFLVLADYESLLTPAQVDEEIKDCAALLRFSYRNALHAHDEAWHLQSKIDGLPELPSVEKYQYPSTPLHAALFRIKPGPYTPGDEKTAFAEFADAESVLRFNTYLVSRDVRLAQPGDLLFYRQLDQDSPYHSMIFVGRSLLAPPSVLAPDDLVVYHTGPIHKHPGELRRIRMADLMRHPSPRWRPVLGNSNFLGVYRWNILKEENSCAACF